MENKNNTELKNAVVTALSDQEFLKKVAEMSSIDEIRALLADRGIEATAEQIEEIINDGHDFGEKAVNDEGELDVDVLEQVAGGGVVGGIILGGIFLVGGIARRSGWKRTLICAGTAFAIGCMAPCP